MVSFLRPDSTKLKGRLTVTGVDGTTWRSSDILRTVGKRDSERVMDDAQVGGRRLRGRLRGVRGQRTPRRRSERGKKGGR